VHTPKMGPKTAAASAPRKASLLNFFWGRVELRVWQSRTARA